MMNILFNFRTIQERRIYGFINKPLAMILNIDNYAHVLYILRILSRNSSMMLRHSATLSTLFLS